MDPAQDLLRQLCQDLRRLRTQAGGPSLRELAEKLGVGKSQLAVILAGQVRRPPDWHVVQGLVEALRSHAADHGRLGHLSLTTSVEEFWRPRHAAVEYAFSHRPITRKLKSAAPATPAVSEPLPPAVPHQLPPAVGHFTGRSGELATLDALAEQEALGGRAAIVAIGGMAGVGKTALAVCWAYRIADQFPDGQLYVNLRGYDPIDPPLTANEVMWDFLIALGVPAERIPAGLAARTGLYRSLLYDRRVLVVLDNADVVDQVRPLLPAGRRCFVLVTSRSRLSGLVVADGARSLMLDVLPRSEAAEFLEERLGRRRAAAEPQAVREIGELCGHLPLALAIVAARALTHPRLALGTLAAELADCRRERGLLDALGSDDLTTDPRALFSWSYRTLSPAAALLFRLLGLHPGPDIRVPAAASLVALPPAQTRLLLAELTDAAVLTENLPGQYEFHDLIREYAAELSRDTDSEKPARTAKTRLFDHHVHSAYAAAITLDPRDDPIPLSMPDPAVGVTVEKFADEQSATAWLDSRRAVLLALLRGATDAEVATGSWQLAWSLDTYLFRSGHRHDRREAWQAALRAAERLDHLAAQALAHRRLANASIRLGRTADALTHNQHAVTIYRQSGDAAGLAATHYNLTHLFEQLGEHERALDHARQALDLYRAAEHRRGQALAHNAIGWYSCLIGDYATGLASCQQALDIFRQLREPHGQATTWDSLGYAHHHLGHHTEALECYRQALHLFRQSESRYDVAVVLIHLGDALCALGDGPAAHTALSEAAAILTDLGHPDASRATERLTHPCESPSTMRRRKPTRKGAN